MTLVGASPSSRIGGLQQLPGKVNYLIGRNVGDWHTNIPTYAMVRYRNVYRGIDLVYRSTGGRLEYDFVVAPRADSSSIRLHFSGPRTIHVDRHGDLVLATTAGEIRDKRPAVYQLNGGVRHTVSGRYILGRNGAVRFQIGTHDESKALVIDPLIVFTDSANLPGGGGARSVALDGSGNIYAAGSTMCLHACTYVVKLTPSDTPVYTTYLGSGGDTTPGGIGVDSQGQSVIVGKTLPILSGFNASGSFPIVNAANPNPGGGPDGFVAKLQPDGNGFVYATYLGGSGSDQANAVAVGADGSAYVTGLTASADFQRISASAYQPNFYAIDCLCGGYFPEAYVAKLGPNGEWVYATYLSGTDVTEGKGIAVDSAGRAVVTGTDSGAHGTIAFPVTVSPDPAHPKTGTFVTMLDNLGQHLVFSTIVTAASDGNGVALDGRGNVYLAGRVPAVSSQGLPGTEGFVTELSSDGSTILRSRNFVGNGNDVLLGIAVDGFGGVYVTGGTTSTSFLGTTPTSPGVVVKLDSSLSLIEYVQYLPGSNGGWSISIDSTGNAYIAAGYLVKLGPWSLQQYQFFQSCTGTALICDPPYTVQVRAASLITVDYAVAGSHCASIRIRISLDGQEVAVSQWLGYGGAPGVYASRPLDTGVIPISVAAPGTHTLSIVGELDPSSPGCNPGWLASWAGTLTIGSDGVGQSSGSDTTPPIITPTVAGTKGTNSWYTSDVTVSWSVTDPESTISSKSGCDATSITTDTAGTTLTCTATSAGGTSTQSVTVKRDATPPAVSGAPDRPADHNGWYNHPLTMTWSAGSDLSGIASCVSPTTYSGPDSGTAAATGRCTDGAGNVGTGSFSFQYDATKPNIAATLSPQNPASTGWYNSATGAPSVSFTCNDAASGIDGSCPASHTFAEGANQSYSASISDKAGNSNSASVTGVNIDLTPPAVTYSGNAGTYTVDQTVNIACNAADTLSGVASTTCKDITGPASSFSVGSNTVSSRATDNAGNIGSGSTSFTVQVTYGSLSTVTMQFIQSSTKYQALPPSARTWIDQQAKALSQYLSSAQIALTPAQRAAAITLYQKAVAALVPLGWLTQAQADTLTRLSTEL